MSATGAETYDDEAFSFALEAAEYERFSQVAPTLGELWPAACPRSQRPASQTANTATTIPMIPTKVVSACMVTSTPRRSGRSP